jgi:membrane protein implicated in regulation of membrane protease activity
MGAWSSVDVEIVGSTGVVVVATRGAAGAGEVLIRLGGGSQTYLARSEEPIEKGTTVLVIGNLGGRTLSVIPLSAAN